MKIVAISDVHGKWNKLQIPECDILISAGDYSFRGEKHMVENFHKWLNKQEAGYIISGQGNHELWVEKNFAEAKEIAEKACPGVHFIGDAQTINIEGIKIFVSACTPWFYDWAWNRARSLGEAQHRQIKYIGDEWAKIEPDTNILVTHGPPYEILDELLYVDGTPKGQFVGCDILAKKITQIKPDLHIFGHIHCGYGQKHLNGTSYYNVAICDEMYMASNPITVIDYKKE